jgi:redox-sensitive bicupin YhaK (pirin superfamily)
MMTIRPAAARGLTRFDWLTSRHTFSFGDYVDPDAMGFGPLRVINEDIVAPGAGFATHGHRDMEIISIILKGALAHRDSLGTGSVIRPGEVQRMSAGTGIRHSEFNASDAEPVHFLQIWIEPERRGLPPSYEQRAVPEPDDSGWRLLGSADGRGGSVVIHRPAELLQADLATGTDVSHRLAPGRRGWLQVVTGAVTLNGVALAAGDGAAVSGETGLTVAAMAAGPASVLLFDLA